MGFYRKIVLRLIVWKEVTFAIIFGNTTNFVYEKVKSVNFQHQHAIKQSS